MNVFPAEADPRLHAVPSHSLSKSRCPPPIHPHSAPVFSRFPNSYQMFGLHIWFIDQVPFVDADFEGEQETPFHRKLGSCTLSLQKCHLFCWVNSCRMTCGSSWLIIIKARGGGHELIQYLCVLVRLYLAPSDFVKQRINLYQFFPICSQLTCCMTYLPRSKESQLEGKFPDGNSWCFY